MRFLKQVSIYTFVGLFGAAVNFFVMPVLSHYLRPADYGVLSLFNTYVTILIPLVSLSAYSLLNVEYFKERNKHTFASKFLSVQIVPVITTAVFALLALPFYTRVADVLELKGTGTGWGLIMLLITFLSIYFEQFFQFLVLQKKAVPFAVYTIGKVLIEVGLTFYFVIGRGMGWEGRIYSWLIITFVVSVAGIVYFYRQGFFNGIFHWRFVRESLQFGSPLILHSLGKFVVNQSDRIFIAKMISIDEAGIYSIGYTVGSLVMILVNAYFNFYSPFLLERLSNMSEDRRLQIVKMTYFYSLSCVGVLILVFLLTPVFFRMFISSSYYGGVRYVFWIALGYCFWGGYMLFSGFIFYFKKNKILGWLSIFNIVTNLTFTYFFIRLFGPIGAAYATALSFFLIMVIIAGIVQRLFPMPWTQFRRIRAVSLS